MALDWSQILQSAAGGVTGGLAGIGVNMIGNALGVGSDAAAKKQLSNQKDLMRYQWENFSSPAAQAASLRAAGLNPAVAMGGQGSAVGSMVPQVGGLSIPESAYDRFGSMSSLENSQSLQALANAKKTTTENSKLSDLIDSQIWNNLASADQQRASAEYQQIQSEFEEKYGARLRDSKAKQQLAQAGAQVALAKLYATQGKTEETQQALNSAQAAAQKALGDKYHSEYELLEKRLKFEEETLRQQIATMKSEQTRNYASAEESRSSAKLNASIKTHQDLVNAISAATNDADINNALLAAEKQGLLNKTQVVDALYEWQNAEMLYRNSDDKASRAADALINYIRRKFNVNLGASVHN